MIWKKSSCAILLFSTMFIFFAADAAFGQVYSRPRVVPTISNPTSSPNQASPITSPPTQATVLQRPTLTNQIVVRSAPPTPAHSQLVKKTADVKPALPTTAPVYAPMLVYSSTMNQRMMQSIQEKIGIRYVYGTEGPSSYDCSGFVWSVFQTAGISFERGSARTLWAISWDWRLRLCLSSRLTWMSPTSGPLRR